MAIGVSPGCAVRATPIVGVSKGETPLAEYDAVRRSHSQRRTLKKQGGEKRCNQHKEAKSSQTIRRLQPQL